MGKHEGKNQLKFLGIDEMIILNGSARNVSILDCYYLTLDGDLCQAVVKTNLNHWIE